MTPEQSEQTHVEDGRPSVRWGSWVTAQGIHEQQVNFYCIGATTHFQVYCLPILDVSRCQQNVLDIDSPLLYAVLTRGWSPGHQHQKDGCVEKIKTLRVEEPSSSPAPVLGAPHHRQRSPPCKEQAHLRAEWSRMDALVLERECNWMTGLLKVKSRR